MSNRVIIAGCGDRYLTRLAFSIELYITFVLRYKVGRNMFFSVICRFFFVSDFHRVHESYNTVFLRGTLYSSHKVLKRNNVVAKDFIFAALAAEKIDYEIIDMIEIFTVSFAYSKL